MVFVIPAWLRCRQSHCETFQVQKTMALAEGNRCCTELKLQMFVLYLLASLFRTVFGLFRLLLFDGSDMNTEVERNPLSPTGDQT